MPERTVSQQHPATAPLTRSRQGAAFAGFAIAGDEVGFGRVADLLQGEAVRAHHVQPAPWRV